MSKKHLFFIGRGIYGTLLDFWLQDLLWTFIVRKSRFCASKRNKLYCNDIMVCACVIDQNRYTKFIGCTMWGLIDLRETHIIMLPLNLTTTKLADKIKKFVFI